VRFFDLVVLNAETLDMKRPVIIGVGGFTSEVGKTTLMCDLLRAFPGWEAIKMTRGHYRSCGKDPDACCVSHLLSDEPVIRSGRGQTYAPGKDTGRYWDAGASNVHWAIVTDSQIEQGIKQALEPVSAQGVFIEGNSFLDFIQADFFVMVARGTEGKIKASARRALAHTSLLYLFDDEANGNADLASFDRWAKASGIDKLISKLPIYTQNNLPGVVAKVRSVVAEISP
jgi:molybdopterin-guanine dinucleotide biosynthesis protein